MALQQPKSIIKGVKPAKSMDFDALKAEGVEEVQRLSGRIWTDYNEHDPGVTILENLCYALTELGYKTNFSIQDLFFKQTQDNNQDFLNTFYRPSEILPPAPITINDFRKLIIDHVKGVKNAWVKPKMQSQVGTRINGLYEVLILVNETLPDPKSIQKEVEELLMKHRNLGEDFDVFRVLENEKIYFEASINMSPDAIGESVYANILNAVQSSFSPTISLYSEEEILEMENGRDIIQNHPPVLNGYVLDSDLEQSDIKTISKIYTSRIIKIISELEGVEEVFDFSFYVGGERIPQEIIQLDDYKVPFLDVDKIILDSKINLYAGDISYVPDSNVIQYTYEIERNRKALKHKRYIEKPAENFSSRKTKEEIEAYISIQNSFPKAYGITDFGIEGKVSNARQAQVNQLRAYLFFFEQIMANYLAQLSNVDKLFSTNEHLDHTYFFQNIKHVNGYEDIVDIPEGMSDIPLAEINRKFDKHQERRNRFLDHMLARFGEEFLMEAYNAIHRESSSLAKSNFLDENISAKIMFLNNFVEISKNKAKGYNYLLSHEDEENVSGLKKKIALLFNFKNYNFKRLDSVFFNKNLKINDSKTNPNKTTFSFNSEDPNFLADVLAFGTDRNNYIIEKKKEVEVYFENRSSRQRHLVYKTKSIKEAEDAITKLLERLDEINSASEGFHILEHILLRDVNAAFRFIYISETNQEIVSEYDYSDSAYSRTEFLSNLLKLGVDKKNYNLTKSGDLYYFTIQKKSFKFKATSENYSAKADAEQAISELIEELSHTKIIDSDLDFRIHLDQDMSNVSIYNEDPYSLQLSFICPKWSGRFRSQKMKYLFENVVKLNAPAHLKINFCWLSIHDMHEFELPYEKWLKLKTENKDRKLIDQLSSYLLLLLKKFTRTSQDKELSKLMKKAKSDLKL